jgi:branched-chain amino acid transport system permease protein
MSPFLAITPLEGLQDALRGPVNYPPAILAYQVITFGVIYLLARRLRPRLHVLQPVGKVVGTVTRPVLTNKKVLLGVALVLPLIELLTGGYYVSVTYSVELFVLLAIGLNIVVGYTGLLDLGYVAFFAVGAYVYGVLASPQLFELVHHTIYVLVPNTGAQGIHISMLLLMPAAGITAALFGVLIGIPTLRLRGDYLAIVTLGFGEITRIFANNLDSPVNITNGPNGVIQIDPVYIGSYSFSDIHNHLGPVQIPHALNVFGLSNDTVGPFAILPFVNYYYLVLLLIVITVFFVARLATSRVGRAWTAIREDEVAAEVAGVNTRNLKLLAYASGGFFGGMAGAVYAAGQHLIAPDSFQLFISILVLCMVVVGGMGSIEGAAVGAIAIGVPYFLSSQLQSLRILIFGAVLVAMISLRPQGIVPNVQRRRELEQSIDEGSGAPHETTVGDVQAS